MVILTTLGVVLLVNATALGGDDCGGGEFRTRALAIVSDGPGRSGVGQGRAAVLASHVIPRCRVAQAITLLVAAGVNLLINICCVASCLSQVDANDPSVQCFPIGALLLGTIATWIMLVPLVVLGGMSTARVLGDGRYTAFTSGTLQSCPTQQYGALAACHIAFWVLLPVVAIPDVWVANKFSPM
jgi:hypothetical protein